MASMLTAETAAKNNNENMTLHELFMNGKQIYLQIENGQTNITAKECAIKNAKGIKKPTFSPSRINKYKIFFKNYSAGLNVPVSMSKVPFPYFLVRDLANEASSFSN